MITTDQQFTTVLNGDLSGLYPWQTTTIPTTTNITIGTGGLISTGGSFVLTTGCGGNYQQSTQLATFSYKDSTLQINKHGICIIGNMDDAAMALAIEVKKSFQNKKNSKSALFGNLVINKNGNRFAIECLDDISDESFKSLKRLEKAFRKVISLDMFW